jgi:hypothetical protein
VNRPRSSEAPMVVILKASRVPKYSRSKEKAG